MQPSPGMPEDKSKGTVSSPTIQHASGKYMAWSPAGIGAPVVLSKERSQDTRWAFGVLHQFSPGRRTVLVGRGIKTFRVGNQGFTFRVQAVEGPFKDCYIGAEEMTAEEVERNK